MKNVEVRMEALNIAGTPRITSTKSGTMTDSQYQTTGANKYYEAGVDNYIQNVGYNLGTIHSQQTRLIATEAVRALNVRRVARNGTTFIIKGASRHQA
eukprot:11169526-Lingulodinium_polyedra.AAC.1